MHNDNLAAMLDSLVETGVYVIEQNTHRFLYYNKRVKEAGPGVELGKKCYEVWKGSCDQCPLIDIGDKAYNHTINCHDPFGDVVDIIANKVLWNGTTPAYVIIVTPHKLGSKDEETILKIDRMYRQSLVTVFNECVIANLTTNYFVNCQKDGLSTDIPERGMFDRENENRSRMMIHPEDLTSYDENFSREAMIKKFGGGKKQIIKRMRRMVDDGSYHMVEFTAARIEWQDDDELWCIILYRDIHEEYLQEQQLNLDFNQLATAVKGAYDMLTSVNLSRNKYRIMHCSASYLKEAPEHGRFGDLVAFRAKDVHPDFRDEFIRRFSREAQLEAFLNGVHKLQMEMRQIGSDGDYHWIYTQSVMVESPHTDDALSIIMSRCIDDERMQRQEYLDKEEKAKEILVEALQKAEAANNAKSDFLSRMSHDIRTPMNVIMGMTSLARLHINEPEKLDDYLKKIELSSIHLMGLINEVLDVNKIESGKIALNEDNMNLYQLVQDVEEIIRPLVQKRRQKLEVYMQEGIHADVSGDEQRIRQALVNILDNASKYTEDGGRIRLSLMEPENSGNEIGMFEFLIEDNGIGMTKEYLQHIYEPFSRADDTKIKKISGTGLGLTIVNNIVQMMGGRIDVESEYSKGTKFTLVFYLKKNEMSVAGEAQKDIKPANDFKGMKVLLVEDNELNQQIAAEMLGLINVDVDLAENGEKAVQAVLEKDSRYYSLVFMDIQMPVMNGYKATELIRGSGKKNIKELPIIAMTADAFNEDIKRARKAGMNGHISKPIDIASIKRVLGACIEWRNKDVSGDRFYFETKGV